MAKQFDRISAAWTRFCEVFGAILLVCIVIALFIQVFTRYVLNNSFTWTEELARFCFIWFTMVGSAVVTRKGTHASITVLSNCLKGRAGKIHKTLVYAVIVVVMALVAVNAMPVIQTSATRLSAALQLPYKYVFLAVPVGCFGIVLNAINCALQLFEGKDAKPAASVGIE